MAANRAVALYVVALAVFMLGMSYVAVPLYRMFCAATGYGGTTQRDDGDGEGFTRPGATDGFWATLVATISNALPSSSTTSSSSSNGGGSSSSSSSSKSTTLEAKRAAAAEDTTGRSARLADLASKRPLKIRFDGMVADNLPWTFRPCQRQIMVRPGESVLAFYSVTNQSKHDVVGVSTYNVVPFKAGTYFNKVQCFCFEEQLLRAGETVDMPVFFYVDAEFAGDERMADVQELVLSYTFYKVEEVGQGLQQLARQGLATPEQEAILAGQLKLGGGGDFRRGEPVV